MVNTTSATFAMKFIFFLCLVGNFKRVEDNAKCIDLIKRIMYYYEQ